VQVSALLQGSGTACRGIGHNGPVASRGKRVASRKQPTLRPAAVLLAFGVTVAVVAWGYLVKAAIDFGVEARSGASGAWLYLALACFGAVACLFAGLMLVARLLRELGITTPDPTPPTSPPTVEQPRPVGGRRAAR
jgi:hypothetical protein